MTQFKIKAGEDRELASAGLYTYPVLQAADILLYQADAVPVGEDQRQHVEIARDIAATFNHRFGQTFVEPRALIRKEGARIMALDEPEKKMSKSGAEASYIALLDPPDVIRKKIARATTDSRRDIVFDEKRPGIFNLLTIYQLLGGESREQIEARVRRQGLQGVQGGAGRPRRSPRWSRSSGASTSFSPTTPRWTPCSRRGTSRFARSRWRRCARRKSASGCCRALMERERREMVTFRYAPEILARYPAVVGGVMLASGLSNGPSSDALRAEYSRRAGGRAESYRRDAAQPDPVAGGVAQRLSRLRPRPDAVSRRGGGVAAAADQEGRDSQRQHARGYRQPGQHPLRAARRTLRLARDQRGRSPCASPAATSAIRRSTRRARRSPRILSRAR